MSRSLIIFALLLAAPLPALAQGVDQIYLSKGAPSRGRIPENGITKEQVTLESSGGAKQFEANEIMRITFADEPAELNNARTHVIQKNYSQAAQELRKVDPQKVERAAIKHEIEYLRALTQARLAMTEGGDKSAAITAMLNF